MTLQKSKENRCPGTRASENENGFVGRRRGFLSEHPGRKYDASPVQEAVADVGLDPVR
jgi:hypothetical protein